MKLNKEIKDFRYKKGMTVSELMRSFSCLGFQAINAAKAVEVIKNMKKDDAKIILSFTSNMGSSGLRGLFAQLIEKKFVDVIITTAGAIEEDIAKAFNKKMYVGSFEVDDIELGKKGINRIGNIFVPNQFYESFEDIFQPMIKKLYEEKPEWNSTDFINSLGKFLKDKNSFVYQAYKNKVPIFCPAITDGASGLQFYFFRNKHKDFKIDIIEDLQKLISENLDSKKVGAIILGGGMGKHQVILGNLLRGGIDYAVYITTSREFSGSLSGATTEEAKSWGKIKGEAEAITVNGDVSIIFPLVISKVLDDLNR